MGVKTQTLVGLVLSLSNVFPYVLTAARKTKKLVLSIRPMPEKQTQHLLLDTGIIYLVRV